MKKSVILSILFLITATVNNSQTLKFKLGIDYNFLIKETKGGNEYNYYSKSVEYPSLSNFYNNNSSLNVGVYMPISIDTLKRRAILLGFDYETGKKELKQSSSNQVLGETLKQNKYVPYAGYGMYLYVPNSKVFLYGTFSFVFTSYKGEGQVILSEGNQKVTVDAKQNYSTATAVRIGGGIELENFLIEDVFIGARGFFEYGATRIKSVEYYYQGEKIGTADVTSNNKIHDNSFMIGIDLGYKFTFTL